jgi:hypothetical protein
LEHGARPVKKLIRTTPGSGPSREPSLGFVPTTKGKATQSHNASDPGSGLEFLVVEIDRPRPSDANLHDQAIILRESDNTYSNNDLHTAGAPRAMGQTRMPGIKLDKLIARSSAIT